MFYADPRDKRIAELEALVESMAAQIAALTAEVAKLKEQLGKNSRNSSLPPSSDGPKHAPPKADKKPSGRAPGGQPGHKANRRTLLPPEQVTAHVQLKPECCEGCGWALSGDDPTPTQRQSIEIPPIRPEVTAYHRHTLRCRRCGRQNQPAWPAAVADTGFGPNLAAVVATFGGVYRLSKRATQRLLRDLLGIEVALGSISQMEKRASAVLAEPWQQAHDAVRTSAVVHADETGWWQGGQRQWLWVARAAMATVFRVADSRRKTEAQTLLGSDFPGILVSDRYGGYQWVPDERRQWCWAHLRRDINAIIERGGRSEALGKSLRAKQRKVFELWHGYRDGGLTWLQFTERIQPVRAGFRATLEKLTKTGYPASVGTARTWLEHEPCLWRFAEQPGIEPTNNTAERALRHAVIWRKTSFGTQSDSGNRFVERVLTVAATLNQQGRSFTEFVADALSARVHDRAPPVLFPLSA